MTLPRGDIQYKNIEHYECVECMIYLNETLARTKDKNEKEVLMYVRNIYNNKDINKNIKKLKKIFKQGRVPKLEDNYGILNAIYSVVTYKKGDK